jgi:hypothetical protein
MQDLATFLLVRGDYAWLGAGWAGCDCYPPFLSAFDVDYGVPTQPTYSETSPGVFERVWTKATVSFDCNKYKGAITMT